MFFETWWIPHSQNGSPQWIPPVDPPLQNGSPQWIPTTKMDLPHWIPDPPTQKPMIRKDDKKRCISKNRQLISFFLFWSRKRPYEIDKKRCISKNRN